MSIVRSAAKGLLWSTVGGWIQLGLSVLTVGLVTLRLGPVLVGTWAMAALVIGFGDLLTGGPLTESLEQRKDLTSLETNATFWWGQILAGGMGVLCVVLAAPLCHFFSAPGAAPLLRFAALGLPLGAVTSFMAALLYRRMQFAAVTQVGVAGGILSSVVAILGVSLGLGVWSLLLSELSGRLLRALGLWRMAGFRPAPPRRLGAAGRLMRFNLHTLATYGLGYADATLPTFLTGALLGPRILGYLIIAQRVLGLLHQLVLNPFSGLSMTATARVQSDAQQLRALVVALYWMASLFAYPAFLGAIVIAPDLARLVGDRWAPAVLTTQLLLLVGLRTTTGIFNVSILRGLGRTVAPMVLLGLGVVLNLVLVPIGARFGAAGVAAAMVVRSFATWPIGLWLIKRHAGVSYAEQARAGGPAFAAALVMALGVIGVLHVLGGFSPIGRLLAGGAAGAVLYPGLLVLFAPKVRRSLLGAIPLLAHGRGRAALARIRGDFLLEGGLSQAAESGSL